MDPIILERTGDRPVKFQGEKIAVASTWSHQGPGQNRWHEVALYTTSNGRFVLSITYNTCWQGEHEHHHVQILQNVAAVADELRNYDPNAYAYGFPEYTEAMRMREEKRRDEVRRRWDVAVSTILADLPEEI